MPGRPTKALPAWLLGSGVIAVAMAVMNLGTYGFTIVAARLLGPREYGAVAALMGLLLIVNVASLGLQATGARRVSSAPADLDDIEADILTATYKSAVGVGVVCALATPVIDLVLRLDSLATAAMVAVTAVPLTLMGGQAGILQGERRWLPLAGIYLALGLGRIGLGLLMLLLRPDALGAMTGVALGAFLPVVVGWWALRHPSRRSSTAAKPLDRPARPGSSRRVLRELVHNSHALLAFFALSNVDVVIARVLLDEKDAGLYAGGLILAKAVLFLPQFIVVVAFPSMAEKEAGMSTTLRALAMVLAIGLTATAFAWLLHGVAVQFIGGSAYAELEPLLWAFALVGTVWAMTQLIVYNSVARQSKGAVGVVWVGLVTLVVVTRAVDSVEALVTAVIVVETVLLAVLLVIGFRTQRAVAAPVERAAAG